MTVNKDSLDSSLIFTAARMQRNRCDVCKSSSAHVFHQTCDQWERPYLGWFRFRAGDGVLVKTKSEGIARKRKKKKKRPAECMSTFLEAVQPQARKSTSGPQSNVKIYINVSFGASNGRKK